MMDGPELLELLPNVIGFFRIDSYPGTIGTSKQAWIFEDGAVRPIARSELIERGAVDIDAEDAADLFNQQPHALDFLKKNAKSSTDQIKPETTPAGGQMKVKVVKKQDT